MRTCFILAMAALAATLHAEEVALRGGAKVQAPLLKDSGDAVVLDLGYDLLRIPRDEVLAIAEERQTPEGSVSTDTNRLYTMQSPDRITTAEAAKHYSPSVVVVKTASGLGSGFFINEKGYLITNFHVIAGEKHIAVTQFLLEGKVLRRIVHKDTVTEGVLSQTHRNFGGILYLQVDAPVNPGNSGGPLFNAHGQVIGIINMGVPTMEGLNFAIPARHAKYILDHIDAFAYDASNPESGFVYPDPPRRPGKFSSEQNKEPKHAR